VLRLDLYVAHGLGGGSTRLHFATAVSF
jgi:hypothetical protein